MLLIQTNTWDGPSAELISSGEGGDGTRVLEAWASMRSLNEALLMFKQYEELFRRRYRSRAVNFHVVGIQVLPELPSPAALEAARITVIEDAIRRLQEEFRQMVNL
jgi:hypothetical protein